LIKAIGDIDQVTLALMENLSDKPQTLLNSSWRKFFNERN